MDDLIRRSDAIRLAEQGQVQGFLWQFEQLVKLPSVQEGKKVVAEIKVDTDEIMERLEEEWYKPNEWIPCDERLPERNGAYIVTRTISDGFEYGNITDACYFDGSDIWHDDTRVNHGRKYLTDVIAWMPLPKPYKEGDENEQIR